MLHDKEQQGERGFKANTVLGYTCIFHSTRPPSMLYFIIQLVVTLMKALRLHSSSYVAIHSLREYNCLLLTT